MKVVLIHRNAPNGSKYPTLTLGREYEVIGVESDHYRLINDVGEPILFDPVCFDVVDSTEPDF